MSVRIERHELGPRLFAGRFRIHHFHAGVALVGLGVWFIARDHEDLTVALRWRRTLRFDPEVGVTTSNVQGGW